MKKIFKIISVLLALTFFTSSIVLGDYSDVDKENPTPESVENAEPVKEKQESENAVVRFIESFANDISAASSFKQTGENTYWKELSGQFVNEPILEPDPDYVRYTVSDSYKLKSFTDEKSYVMYLLSPKGYAVYDEISGVAEEIMPGADDPFENITEGEFYYGGPMNFIVKSNGIYTLDNKELSDLDILNITAIERSTAESRSESKGIPDQTIDTYIPTYQYFTTMLNHRYGNNAGGESIQVACEIMLGYYDYYVNDQYVPTGYHYYVHGIRYPGTKNEDIDDGVPTFLSHLKTFLGSDNIYLAAAQTGLQSYFASKFFTTPSVGLLVGASTVKTRVVTNVSNDVPTVISMSSSVNPSCPYNTTVVAYGTREVFVSGVNDGSYYFVHKGTKSTGSDLGSFSCDWFFGGLYIY